MNEGNIPATIDQYTTSAIVNVPLHELDRLRADLMKSNAELAKMRETESQVKITFQKAIVEEGTKYDAGWGYKEYTKDAGTIQDVMYVKMQDVLAELQKKQDKKLEAQIEEIKNEAQSQVKDIKSEYRTMSDLRLQELEDQAAEMNVSYTKMKETLHEQYNGDRIELLEAQVGNLESKLADEKEEAGQLAGKNAVLEVKVANLFPYFEKVKRLKRIMDETMVNNVFDRFLKGFYKNIDRVLEEEIKNG